MRLPGLKRLEKQNFKDEDQDLIETLAFTINNDLDPLYEALNRKLSLKDNLFCTVKDVIIIVDANGIPKNSASFQLDNVNMRVLGCNVLKVINQTISTSYPTSSPFISFGQNSNIVNINHITGLQSDQQYLITVVAYGT